MSNGSFSNVDNKSKKLLAENTPVKLIRFLGITKSHVNQALKKEIIKRIESSRLKKKLTKLVALKNLYKKQGNTVIILNEKLKMSNFKSKLPKRKLKIH